MTTQPENLLDMSPSEAWEYAASWGSFIRSGDPGACMYGFDERCLPQSEEHRANVLAYIETCRAIVQESPEHYDDDELLKMDAFVDYIKTAPVDKARFS